MDYIKVDAHFKTLNILNVSFELYFAFIMSDFDPSFLLLNLRKKCKIIVNSVGLLKPARRLTNEQHCYNRSWKTDERVYCGYAR